MFVPELGIANILHQDHNQSCGCGLKLILSFYYFWLAYKLRNTDCYPMELCGCLANELCHMLTECRNLYCVMRFFLSSDRVVETIVTSHVYRIQKTWLCHKANLSLHRVVETIVPSHIYRIPKTLLCHKANLSLHRGVKTIVTSITLSNQTFLNFPSVVLDVLHATSIPPPAPHTSTHHSLSLTSTHPPSPYRD